MRIVIAGSGGIGGYFGARLARAGEDVVFLARGEHLCAMQDNGLTVRSAVDGEWKVPVSAVDSLEGQEPADLVLFCVKSYDTQSVAELLRPVIGPETAVVSLQNGIDNEEKLAGVLGEGRVLGGVAYIFANIEQPGVIAHHQLGRIILGEMAGGDSERASAIAETLERAGIEAAVDPAIRTTLWRKYLFLVALSGTTAVTRLPVRFTREVAETRELWNRQLEELIALAEADGAGLDHDAVDTANSLLESLGADNYSSLYHDLAAGKRLELEALHGHAVRLGRRYGIPTPTLFAVYAALAPYLDGAPGVGSGGAG
ncbi:MAG TPA: 2-dehydropantoate 2-reductase [Arenicellales bacterium]|nr:2-dehydropantoate 2-reductase [Arenicellales bacterium]